MEERLRALRKFVQWCPFASGSGRRRQHGEGRCWSPEIYTELAGVPDPLPKYHRVHLIFSWYMQKQNKTKQNSSVNLWVLRPQTLGCKPLSLCIERYGHTWTSEGGRLPGGFPSQRYSSSCPKIPNLTLDTGSLFSGSVTSTFCLVTFLLEASARCDLVAGGMALPCLLVPKHHTEHNWL